MGAAGEVADVLEALAGLESSGPPSVDPPALLQGRAPEAGVEAGAGAGAGDEAGARAGAEPIGDPPDRVVMIHGLWGSMGALLGTVATWAVTGAHGPLSQPFELVLAGWIGAFAGVGFGLSGASGLAGSRGRIFYATLGGALVGTLGASLMIPVTLAARGLFAPLLAIAFAAASARELPVSRSGQVVIAPGLGLIAGLLVTWIPASIVLEPPSIARAALMGACLSLGFTLAQGRASHCRSTGTTRSGPPAPPAPVDPRS